MIFEIATKRLQKYCCNPGVGQRKHLPALVPDGTRTHDLPDAYRLSALFTGPLNERLLISYVIY